MHRAPPWTPGRKARGRGPSNRARYVRVGAGKSARRLLSPTAHACFPRRCPEVKKLEFGNFVMAITSQRSGSGYRYSHKFENRGACHE